MAESALNSLIFGAAIGVIAVAWIITIGIIRKQHKALQTKINTILELHYMQLDSDILAELDKMER